MSTCYCYITNFITLQFLLQNYIHDFNNNLTTLFWYRKISLTEVYVLISRNLYETDKLQI